MHNFRKIAILKMKIIVVENRFQQALKVWRGLTSYYNHTTYRCMLSIMIQENEKMKKKEVNLDLLVLLTFPAAVAAHIHP